MKKKIRKNARLATVGKRIRWKGQSYTLIRIKPYERKDGRMSVVLVWQSRCAECGKSFEASTGRNPSSWKRRCPEHAIRGRPIPDPAKEAEWQERLKRRRQELGIPLDLD
jgi:hypothetical protein